MTGVRPAHEVLAEDFPSVTIELDEGDVLTDVLIIGRVKRYDQAADTSTLLISASEGVDTFLELGMLDLAHTTARAGLAYGDGGDR